MKNPNNTISPSNQNNQNKLTKLEVQIENMSGNLTKFSNVLDRNTENLIQLSTVQKIFCDKVSDLGTEINQTNKSIKNHTTEIHKHDTEIAVIKEKFQQFKRLGITASLIVGCVSIYKILYSVFPV